MKVKLRDIIGVGIALSILITGGLIISCTEKEPSRQGPTVNRPIVELNTSIGRIVLELYEKETPQTVNNFLQYVRSGHYNGTIFHRVIPGFMIQGGGFDKDLERRAVNPPIQNEADNGQKNRRGTIAMARTMAPHSATDQFFINTVNNDFLDHQQKDQTGWGYSVFGHVIEGMEVVDSISSVETRPKGMFRNLPKDPIVIHTAILKDPKMPT